MIHPIRVIFGDTDQMGVVYYANYLRYFESARADYWRTLGRSYREVEARGLGLPVVEAHCNYRRPARYEDLLEVELELTELRAVSMRFGYIVRRGDEVLADGYTRHAVVSTAGKPTPLPADLRADLIVRPLSTGAPAR